MEEDAKRYIRELVSQEFEKSIKYEIRNYLYSSFEDVFKSLKNQILTEVRMKYGLDENGNPEYIVQEAPDVVIDLDFNEENFDEEKQSPVGVDLLDNKIYNTVIENLDHFDKENAEGEYADDKYAEMDSLMDKILMSKIGY